MILRRYGKTLQSVETVFESTALTEIGFRRDGTWSMDREEFEASHRRLEERELAPEATGWVQGEVEKELLDRLEEQLHGLARNLAEDEVLVVENEQGVDYPKTREKRETAVVEGENRYRFHWWVDPPLRVGIYRRET